MSLKNSSEYLLLNITQVTMSDGQKISIMCTDVVAISLVIWRYCDILKLFDFQFHFLFSFWNLKVVEFCRCDMCPPEMSVCETTRVLERERVCVEYIKKISDEYLFFTKPSVVASSMCCVLEFIMTFIFENTDFC